MALALSTRKDGTIMSRKHNTKHARKVSRYPQRLKARGETNATVRMDDLDTLRKAAKRREQGETE